MESNNSILVKRQWVGSILAAIAVLVGLVLIAPMLSSEASGAAARGTMSRATPSPTASATTEPELCSDTWAMEEADHTNNRWFYKGIASIYDAKTNEEAMDAAHDWLAEVRKDPGLLAGAAKLFLQKDVDPATLASSEGCATKAAADLEIEIGMTISSSKVSAGEAPTSATNTGVQDGTVVGSSFAGISGDRTAIQVTLPDGRTIWILARCGNPATAGPPPLPPGKTDQPAPPPETPVTPVCPPDMPHGTPPNCKDSPTRDPAQNGNAPVGGGPNANPGPGTYVPPAQMQQPPSTPRPNPAPPAPEPPAPQPPTPSNPSPAPVPTPDPAPAPSPRPSAPPPPAPETGCDASAPGGSDC